MADNLTNYLENALVNHVFRNTELTSPAAVYIGLTTSDPGETGSVAGEISGNAYVRQAITFGAPSDGSITTTALIEFPVATGDWGTISHIGIFDAESSGNMLAYGALSVAKDILTDDQFKIQIGDLTLSLS